ncbi:nucleotidyltransferase domain-containing protein [Trichlorobacter lovleyi]|uniref:nucleotidyltransferase domain-containing protein n=1 Tax=Trichlorobacter lovleyi TaxID=313985 RepID=UPI0023F2C34A|nr:nucleotidyltransferase domain-containing protein [Trichlorobacter lovleyi]
MLDELSIETRTLFAELMERLAVREAQRNIGNLEGSFSTKSINGRDYLYFQHYVAGGTKRSICLGQKTAALEELVRQHKIEHTENQQDPIGIRELCAQLKAGRIATASHPVARVIRELADSAVFRVGGVLIGTHAFGCIGNLLGVRWDETTLGTLDIDVAAERNVSIAVPGIRADIPKALESLSMGFFPVPRLNPAHPSTTFAVRKSPLRVDLLTPKISQSEDPVFIPRLNAAAQPLSHLDYLITDPIPCCVINGDAIAVMVPQPLVFGLHKLIVSQLRDVTSGAKTHKDLYQAYQILSYFDRERPFELQQSWKELISKGGAWKKRAEAGLAAVKKFGELTAI